MPGLSGLISLGGAGVGALFLAAAVLGDGPPQIDTANAAIAIGFAVIGHVVAQALDGLRGGRG